MFMTATAPIDDYEANRNGLRPEPVREKPDPDSTPTVQDGGQQE